MNSVIKELKKTAISKDNFTWEREKAIDIIACIDGGDAKKALAEISSEASFGWERERALNHLKTNC